MGGTISITIRECARIDRVRELYHNKKMMKDLFNAIREHGTPLTHSLTHSLPHYLTHSFTNTNTD
jgi:hypothetical protein